MKTGYFLGYCILILLLSSIPASADPITVTVTRVNITQNGNPITSSVDYTMNCYGHSFYVGDASWRAGHKITKILNSSGTDDYQYSYSATCEPGRCDIYEYYDTWAMMISHCDINGTYQGHPFIIRNFSQDPLPSYCIRLYAYPVHETGGWKFCMDEQCHETINVSETKGASRYCELNFDLSKSSSPAADTTADTTGVQLSPVQSGLTPSQNDTIQNQRVSTQNTTSHSRSISPIGPVESFYCSILKFFGADC
jgi:hypothetical protein